MNESDEIPKHRKKAYSANQLRFRIEAQFANYDWGEGNFEGQPWRTCAKYRHEKDRNKALIAFEKQGHKWIRYRRLDV